MTGEELIQYGFKRIIEELQKIQRQNEATAELLRKIELNTFTVSGEILNTNKAIKEIYDMATLSELATMEIKQIITREIKTHGGTEKI